MMHCATGNKTARLLFPFTASVAVLSLWGCHKNDKTENPPITIQSFSPEQGMAGDTIVITGANWSTNNQLDTVWFNTAKAQVVSATASALTVVVPAEATTGKVLVKTGETSAASAKDFTVKPHEVSSFAPLYGKAGDLIEISGVGFAENSKVYFGTVAAIEVVYVNRTKVKAKVPATATTAKIAVESYGKTVTSAAAFTVSDLEADFDFSLATDVIPGQAKCHLFNHSDGADSYQWEVGTAKYNTFTPSIWFYKSGNYSVKLIARKGELADTLVKEVQVTLDNSLLTYYAFAGNALDSVNNVAAIVHNATPAAGRTGAANSAYYFNGTDAYIKLPEGLITGTNTSATISLWFQADDPFDAGILFGYQSTEIGGASPASYVPSVYLNTYKMLNGKFWFGTSPMIYIASMNSAWHHLVITGDGMGQKLYIDGANKVNSGDMVTHAGDMIYNQLGGGYFGGAWPGIPGDQWSYFKGKIDDVRVYNRKLSDAEVAALSNE